MPDSGDTPMRDPRQTPVPREGDHASGPPGEHLDEDACIDIVAGLLTGPRLRQAVDHARTCPDCEHRLMVAGADLESARARSRLSGRPEPGHASEDPAGGRPRRNPVLRVAVPLALAAAAFILILRGFPLRLHPVAGIETYWIPVTSDFQRLRGSHAWDADSAFWGGLKAYDAHELGQARQLLESAHAGGGLEDLRRLYLAGVLVNQGAAREALALLDALRIDELPLPWREDAFWLQYQALAASGQRERARGLLDRMIAWPGRIGDLARKAAGRSG